MNNFRILLLLIVSILLSSQLGAQAIRGTVFESGETMPTPLPGVNIYWSGTQQGTVSDENGKFSLAAKKDTHMLVFSFVGFLNDTLHVYGDEGRIKHTMSKSITLREVEVSSRAKTTYVSRLGAVNATNITAGELTKAACCNLSESFETNASVDVSYSDAVTGAKQIQLLGLSGIYSQIQSENIPFIRGMASAYGLNYIPGPWMESIQISKGSASVINGYESITGQINVEYKKPTTSEKLYVNLFGNSNGRAEINLSGAYVFNKKWSSLLLVHGDYFGNKINNIDKTNILLDGKKETLAENFIDIPLVNTINVFNRWEYHGKRYEARFGIKHMRENRYGGTLDFDKETFVLDTAKINRKELPYGFEMRTQRTEAFIKNGILFPEKKWKSIGIILSAVNHQQNGFFGVNNYTGQEHSIYTNMIYRSIIGNENHVFSTGLSYLYDDFRERYDQTQFTYIYQTLPSGQVPTMQQITTLSPQNPMTLKNYNFDRTESVAGSFFEYTYTLKQKLVVMTGLRADYHNTFGLFFTPRVHLKYQMNETSSFRLTVGLGYRTANLISENISLLASQRILVIQENLRQEKAANYGINFTKEFNLFTNPAELNIDAYRTDFINQVVVDIDSDPTKVYFSNLKSSDKSFANSAQIQLTMEPVKRFTLLLAMRLNDTRQTLNDTLQQKPMVNRFKGLVSCSYATPFEIWKFDISCQINGSARITPQYLMPAIVRRDYSQTPVYAVVFAQVTKRFKHNLEIYLGGENLTNFVQQDPITEPFIPYHTHFDSMMAWGPLVGTTIYAGLRYAIK
jgi:outer membrane receptor for ferrienterochelin and colicin